MSMKLPVTQEVLEVQEEVGRAVAMANGLSISDNDTFQQAGTLLKEVVSAKKAVKNAKDKFTLPAKQIIEQAKELFDAFEKDVAQGERILKTSMVDFAKLIEADREKLAGRLEARVERGTMRLDTAIRKVGDLANIDYQSAGVTKTTSKKVRIVNPELVPKEFWGIDEVLVRKVSLGNKAQGIEPEVIPGVEVYEDTSLSMR